jgi:hypothetical protein
LVNFEEGVHNWSKNFRKSSKLSGIVSQLSEELSQS